MGEKKDQKGREKEFLCAGQTRSGDILQDLMD